MATVVGLFDNSAQAQSAVEQLRANGVSPNDISVVMRQGDTANTVTTTDTEVKDTGGGIVTGAVGGGVLGGLAGLLVGIGAIAIPGLGALVVAGPVATTLIGAGVGAAAGGLVGALTEAGVPEEEARVYETGVKQGGVLVTARVPAGMEAQASNIMNSNGARDIRNDPNLMNTTTTNTTYNDTGYVESERNPRHEVAGEATGGVAGAATGAAIGSVAGPVGTVAGGVIGAAAGGAAGKGVADAADENKAEHDANIYHNETDTTYRTDTEA